MGLGSGTIPVSDPGSFLAVLRGQYIVSGLASQKESALLTPVLSLQARSKESVF